MTRMTQEQYDALQEKRKISTAGEPKKSKYGNRRTEVNGILFDSAREAARWSELTMMENAGLIRYLKRQVSFPLIVNDEQVAQYRADFTYSELAPCGEWVEVVEDVKGVRTPLYKLKFALMRACLGITIRET